MRQTDATAKQNYKHAYDNRYDVRPLPELEPGNSVAVKLDDECGWTKTAKVLKQCDSPRSYLVQTDRGVLRRNRRHIQPLLSAPETPVRSGEGNVRCDRQLHSPVPEVAPPLVTPPVTMPPTPARVTSSDRLVRSPDRYGDYVLYSSYDKAT